jgi:hypothetical protein
MSYLWYKDCILLVLDGHIVLTAPSSVLFDRCGTPWFEPILQAMATLQELNWGADENVAFDVESLVWYFISAIDRD